MATRTLQDLIRESLGIATFPAVNRVVSQIGVAAEQIMRQQPNRLAFLIVNLGTDSIYVGPFNDVAATKGVQVAASGGNVSAIYTEDFDLVGYEWFGIANVAATPVLILELLSDPKGGGT